MKGGGKVHGSLQKPSAKKNKPSKVYTQKKRRGFLNKLKIKYTIKTLKRKILKKQYDETDAGIVKNFLLRTNFLKAFIAKYDKIMKSNNEDKKSNYSIFASNMAVNISAVVKDYSEIINNNSNNSNSNLINLLENVNESDPIEYLKEYINFIKGKDIVEKFANIALKYYSLPIKNNKAMEFNNNNNSETHNSEEITEDYKTYYGFINDSANAIIESIKQYYPLDLNGKNKIAIDSDIDDLIKSLTATKIVGAPEENIRKVIVKNSSLNDGFLNAFAKLGL